MEKKYFKVRIEFDQDRYNQIIEDAVKNDIPGYWRFIKTLPTMIWNEKKMLRAESQSA